MYMAVWAATDVGRRRRSNQDEYLIDAELGLVLLADGVGGLYRGDLAASLACRAAREHVSRSRSTLLQHNLDPTAATRQDVLHVLREALQVANSQVFRAGTTLSEGKGMSTTLEAVLVIGNTVFIGHVGDSRTYLCRDGECAQLTEDHSVAQERARRGLANEPGAAKNVITRAIGMMPSVAVDTLSLAIEPGDLLLLCSDGLTRYVENGEMHGHIRPPLAKLPEALVDLANRRGGVDNTTVVIVSLTATAEAATPALARVELLRGFPLLEAATQRELSVVASYLEERELRAGRFLFREGEPGYELYLVLDGEVVITHLGNAIAHYGPGSCFGEMAVMDGGPRAGSALVTRTGHALVLSRHRFHQLLREDTTLASGMLNALVRQLATTVRKQNAASSAES